MLLPPSTVFEHVREKLPPEFVHDDALDRCMRRMAGLPRLFGWCGLECRLGEDDRQLDFIGCMEAHRGSREQLARLLQRGAELGPLEPARRVLEEWVRDGSPLARESTVLWTEFDLPEGPAPDPFLYICIDRNYLRAARSRNLPLDRIEELIRLVANLILGHDPATEQLRLVRSVLERLPARAQVRDLAMLHHRGLDHLRMVVHVDRDEAIPWLRSIGLAVDMDALGHALGSFVARIPGHDVMLDFSDRLEPILGTFVSFDTSAINRRHASDLLDVLVARSLCTPAKAAALATWIGHETVDIEGCDWPVNIQRHLGIKHQLRGEHGWETKAYLTMLPQFSLL